MRATTIDKYVYTGWSCLFADHKPTRVLTLPVETMWLASMVAIRPGGIDPASGLAMLTRPLTTSRGLASEITSSGTLIPSRYCNAAGGGWRTAAGGREERRGGVEGGGGGQRGAGRGVYTHYTTHMP